MSDTTITVGERVKAMGICHGAILALLACAYFDVDFAENVARFAMIVIGLAAGIVAFQPPTKRIELLPRSTRRAVHWITAIEVFAAAGLGWFITATIFGLGAMLMFTAREVERDKERERERPQATEVDHGDEHTT